MLHEPVKALKPLPMLELPKIPGKGRQQTLQEWHAAGGSVPMQYKSRPHVWHAKVKKYAEGGPVGDDTYGSIPDNTEGGLVQIGQHFADGGAAFGKYPAMKPSTSKGKKEAQYRLPLDVARGAVAGVLGMPGDLETLGRLGVNLAFGPGGVDVSNESFLPTSEDIEKRIPFRGTEPVNELGAGFGSLIGGLSPAPAKAAIQGAKAVGRVAAKAPKGVEAIEVTPKSVGSSGKLEPLEAEAKTAQAGKPTGATYATKQEGPFFRVSPATLGKSKAASRGVREADELQGSTTLSGSEGAARGQVPKRLTNEEVARIIADPNSNEPLKIAIKYTKENRGTNFGLPNIPESSLAKQSAIGRAQSLASDESPQYKSAIFGAYSRQMPDLLESIGAKNYDDLMEKAYRQMAKETDQQFKALPYNFSYHRAGEGNYLSSREMASDVHGNKHLYVYQGGDPHTFLNRVDPHTGLNENEKFRAVHDLLGHSIFGNEFGPKGEEIAWAAHQQMYSPLARLAMTAETRGQNSLVNYTPLNAELKAQIAKFDDLSSQAKRKGDKTLVDELNRLKREAYEGLQFAPNKAVLLPPEFLNPEYTGGMPGYLKEVNKPTKGTETQSVLTHFSNEPDLTFIDPSRYGTGIKGAEAARLRELPGGVSDRSHFYLGEPGSVAPEAGLGTNRYRGEASSLYDLTQDPLMFSTLARESNRTPFTAKYNQGVTYPLQDANDIERLAKEYGYQGVSNPKATKPMAIMFEETPVERRARGGLASIK